MNRINVSDKYTRFVDGLNSLVAKYYEIEAEEQFLKNDAQDIIDEINFLKNYPILDPSCRKAFRETNRIVALEEEHKKILWQLEQLEVEKAAIKDCYLEQSELVSIAKSKLPNYGFSDEDIEEMATVKRIRKIEN